MLFDRFNDYTLRRKETTFIKGVTAVVDKYGLPRADITGLNQVNFIHGGHLGDIIYSIPAMQALSEGKQMNLYLKVGVTVAGGDQKQITGTHPNGQVMLTPKSAELLAPLLLQQPLFADCGIYEQQSVQYDLDLFREYPFDYRMSSCPRWYMLTYGVHADLSKPWLSAPPDTSLNDTILIGRTLRARAPLIDYSFLKKYPKLAFVGMDYEYQEMKKVIPHLEYKPVKNFLELASYIAGCKFYVGNQSFPFSLAEAMKVKRVMEVYYRAPNVIPEGPGGYDFCYQPHFEEIVRKLYEEQ